eukprot:1146490-Prymnesium_polylepis.1
MGECRCRAPAVCPVRCGAAPPRRWVVRCESHTLWTIARVHFVSSVTGPSQSTCVAPQKMLEPPCS